jgi:hypothetical protein
MQRTIHDIHGDIGNEAIRILDKFAKAISLQLSGGGRHIDP